MTPVVALVAPRPRPGEIGYTMERPIPSATLDLALARRRPRPSRRPVAVGLAALGPVALLCGLTIVERAAGPSSSGAAQPSAAAAVPASAVAPFRDASAAIYRLLGGTPDCAFEATLWGVPPHRERAAVWAIACRSADLAGGAGAPEGEGERERARVARFVWDPRTGSLLSVTVHGACGRGDPGADPRPRLDRAGAERAALAWLNRLLPPLGQQAPQRRWRMVRGAVPVGRRQWSVAFRTVGPPAAPATDAAAVRVDGGTGALCSLRLTPASPAGGPAGLAAGD